MAECLQSTLVCPLLGHANRSTSNNNHSSSSSSSACRRLMAPALTPQGQAWPACRAGQEWFQQQQPSLLAVPSLWGLLLHS